MAGRNGMGPREMGPMSGRGLGPCGGGYSYGRPRSRSGRGRRGYSTSSLYEGDTKDESKERDFLEKEKTALESRVKEINSALDKI